MFPVFHFENLLQNGKRKLVSQSFACDYNIVCTNGYKIFATHGHIYNKENMPELSRGDVFIHGHFHLPMAENYEGIYFLNPGSITLPKGGFPNSYAILENDEFIIKDLEGKIINSIKIN